MPVTFELQQFEQQNYPVAGVDEVGRGAIFGSVVAAAVILPLDQFDLLSESGVTDSKKLTHQKRVELDQLIRDLAIAWAVGVATIAEIEEFNILGASLLAMERAIAQLKPAPKHCLIDGNQPLRFQLIAPMPQTTIVKGDSRSLSIAAASIVAKVWRDRLITDLAEVYAGYDLAQNKGYGTAKHKQGIAKLGLTDMHRSGFNITIPNKS